MKKVLLAPIVFYVISCATNAPAPPPRPTGEYVWTHSELYQKAGQGEISDAELKHAFITDKNKCKIEALQVPVPSPSCSTIAPPDCSRLKGFAYGYCIGQRPRQECNYSSVDAAQNAQNEIFKSCMELGGWSQVWQPYNQQSLIQN